MYALIYNLNNCFLKDFDWAIYEVAIFIYLNYSSEFLINYI